MNLVQNKIEWPQLKKLNHNFSFVEHQQDLFISIKIILPRYFLNNLKINITRIFILIFCKFGRQNWPCLTENKAPGSKLLILSLKLSFTCLFPPHSLFHSHPNPRANFYFFEPKSPLEQHLPKFNTHQSQYFPNQDSYLNLNLLGLILGINSSLISL